jgi:hypothetical protein
MGQTPMSRTKVAVAFLVAAFLVLLVWIATEDSRYQRCRSGEDEAIEQEFEDDLRVNCDDLAPPWR